MPLTCRHQHEHRLSTGGHKPCLRRGHATAYRHCRAQHIRLTGNSTRRHHRTLHHRPHTQHHIHMDIRHTRREGAEHDAAEILCTHPQQPLERNRTLPQRRRAQPSLRRRERHRATHDRSGAKHAGHHRTVHSIILLPLHHGPQPRNHHHLRDTGIPAPRTFLPPPNAPHSAQNQGQQQCPAGNHTGKHTTQDGHQGARTECSHGNQP